VLVAGAALVAAAALLVLIFSGGGTESNDSASRSGLAIGKAAPAVALPSASGPTVDLNSFRGKRNVLLYFYEHAG